MDVCQWLAEQRSAGSRIVGIELAEAAVRLADLPAARQRTIAVLGHEQIGIPAEVIDLLDVAVKIPMVGTAASLNVAVAGLSCSTGSPGSSDHRDDPTAHRTTWQIVASARAESGMTGRFRTGWMMHIHASWLADHGIESRLVGQPGG
jgi:tRNA C32,U32 (ribose-2'-O)-methylase TrmJ